MTKIIAQIIISPNDGVEKKIQKINGKGWVESYEYILCT